MEKVLILTLNKRRKIYVTDVCAAVVAPVNADIGGIGVKSP